jgi:hypothetical protein
VGCAAHEGVYLFAALLRALGVGGGYAGRWQVGEVAEAVRRALILHPELADQ